VIQLKKTYFILFLAAYILFITSTGVAIGANEKVKVPEPANNRQVENADTEEISRKIDSLEREINNLQSDLSNSENKYASTGLVLFLFGSFCAVWAQNTGRNSLGWFIGGAIFNFIAVLFLLKLNYDDKNPPKGSFQ